jgi:hypothetical protein
MYYISQPPGFSLEEHIVNLEDLYAESFKNDIEASTRKDIGTDRCTSGKIDQTNCPHSREEES